MTTPCTLFEKYEEDNQGNPRTRRYRFDLNALADFEQEVGMGFGQLMQMKAAFAMVRALIFSGLKHEDRTLTIEYVGDLIFEAMQDGATLDDLLTDAFKAATEQGALGKPKADGDQQVAEAKVPNGDAGGGSALQSVSNPTPGQNG